MKKHFTLKKISLIVLALLIVIQVFRIDKTIQPLDESKDFIALTSANSDIKNSLITACYDCHSNQPAYPWYSNIAPISWWIKNHIHEGNKHLNFSVWGDYSDKRKHHKLEECVEMIEEGEMPMTSYTLMHKEAKLTDIQKLQLISFFKGQMQQMNLPEDSNEH